MELGPVVLEGSYVRLEPLTQAHAGDLVAAGADPELWRWFPSALDSPDSMEKWVDEAIAASAGGTEYPFAVIDKSSGRAIGSTRYLDVSNQHRGVEVGWTWYSRSHWATAMNPESKYLLLGHAFESWRAIRLCLKTDSLNARSRAAILRLGAIHEGELRNHRIRQDGTYRHSSYYSILDTEWPDVKRRLELRLSHFR